MATGYGEGGSADRLLCVGPPDAGGGGGEGGPGDLIPNVFYGGGIWAYNAVPQVTVGLNDVSFEVWFKPVHPSFQDQGWRISLSVIGSAGAERFYVWTNTGATEANADYQPGGSAGLFPVDPKWNHLVARYDRDVQVELWVNGVEEDQAALADAGAPTNWGALEFYPPFVSTGNAIDDDENLNWAVGPIALHTGLLTAAQMLDSMRRKGVQLLATTLLAYDWRGLSGHTGWETSLANMEEGIRDTFEQSDDEPGCPRGVNGTVVIPDISGNNRNVTLSTSATYAANAGRCAFARDLFFR